MTPPPWTRISTHVGYYAFPGNVRRYYADKESSIPGVTIPTRGVCTIRPETTSLVPFSLYTWGGIPDYSDFSGGGAAGIDPCGIDLGVLHHDRVMMRCPIERLDMATGQRIYSPVANYNLSRMTQIPGYDAPRSPYAYDGEHLIRAYRTAIPHMRDPIVRMDCEALLADAMLFWQPYGEAILDGPGGRGHGYVGRSWAWTAYLAWLLDNETAVAHLIRVARHVIDPATGSPQRLKQGEFYGSPDPWRDSGVPAGTDVCQDLEQSILITVFAKLGMKREAVKLADTVLKKPLRKWIDCETGLGVGTDYADPAQAWFALGALAELDKRRAVEFAKTWPIMRDPKVYGGSVGPFEKLSDQRKALTEANEPGKNGWYLAATK
jgi:hypothetical protein